MYNWNHFISFVLYGAAIITIGILQYRGDIGLAWVVSIISTTALVMALICRQERRKHDPITITVAYLRGDRKR